MKSVKLLLIGMAAVLAMGLSLAISQVVLAEGELGKKDIAQDNTNINNNAGELPDDNFAIKEDRRALKDAIDSGDKEKMKEAQEALREDLKDRAKARKDVQKEEKEKREDRRRTHSGNRDKGKDAFGMHQDTFGLHQDTFNMHNKKDKLNLHQGTFDIHQDTFDIHQDKF
jgi:hypothetical protein